MTFENCGVVSIPSLKTVTGSLRFEDNAFTDFGGNEAPLLVSIYGYLTLVRNMYMTNFSLTKLQFLGGNLTVQDNPRLTTLDGFPSLQTVGGNVNLTGNFGT